MLYLIVTGGPLPDKAADLIKHYSDSREDTVIIGCDGGCDFLARHGIIPGMALGDMDSITDAGLKFIESNNVFTERYPVEKDWTDTEIALDKTGSDDVIIVTPDSGRLDHLIANLQLVLKERAQGKQIIFTDGITFCYPLSGEDSVEVDIRDFDYPLSVSLIPWNFGSDVKGVTTKGLYYALENHDLTAGVTFSFSNKPAKDADKISVSIKSGLLLVVVTKNV